MATESETAIWHYLDLAKYVGLLSRGLFFALPSALRNSDPWEGSRGELDFTESLDATVRVWDVMEGSCVETMNGQGDIFTIAGAINRLRWRALRQGRESETMIDEQMNAVPVSWFPAALNNIATHPNGPTWTGADGRFFYAITLEGSDPSS